MRDEVVEIGGTIGELLSSERFCVVADNGHFVLATLSGRLANRAWSVRVGDRVTMQVALERPVPGRIVQLAREVGARRDSATSVPETEVAALAGGRPPDGEG